MSLAQSGSTFESSQLDEIQDGLKELKALLRRAGARTREALVEAMGRAQEVEEETKASPELPPPR